MNAPARLPENIVNDIGIYLAPDEKIVKALSAFSPGKMGAGQVWLILTSQSIIFHTCENNKEPLLALLARKEIKEIEYFQKSVEILLTFIPKRNSQKSSRLAFSLEKQDELEDFCEDLADLINFKKETNSGVKSYIAPKLTGKKEPELRHATSSTRHENKIETATRTESQPASNRKPELTASPDVKIVTPSPALVTPSVSSGTSTLARDSGEFKVSYVIVATLISVIVAFIWYKFFSYNK